MLWTITYSADSRSPLRTTRVIGYGRAVAKARALSATSPTATAFVSRWRSRRSLSFICGPLFTGGTRDDLATR